MLADVTSNIMRPPLPKSPHFPLKQTSIKARSTIATTAVVKKALHNRALLHLQHKGSGYNVKNKKGNFSILFNHTKHQNPYFSINHINLLLYVQYIRDERPDKGNFQIV